MTRHLALLLLAGCGRLSFDSIGSDAEVRDAAIDAVPCTGMCLDETFNGTGLAVLDVNGVENSTFAYQGLALQTDGKILVAAKTGATDDPRAAVIRFTDTGRLDTTFGAGTGVVTMTEVAGSVAISVVQAPDGSIVFTGAASSRGIVGRLEADGTRRTSFGTNGIFTSLLGATDLVALNGVVVDTANNIFVGGQGRFAANGYNLVFARLSPTGTQTLGLTTDAYPLDQFGALMGFTPNNEMYLVGQTYNGINFDGFLDSIDPVTGANTGIDRFVDQRDSNTADLRFKSGIFADQTYMVLTGQVGPVGGAADVALTRGMIEVTSPDVTFGTGGFARFDLGGDEEPRCVVKLPDGRYVVGVRQLDTGRSLLAIVSPTGELVTTFEVTVPGATSSGIDWLVVDPLGRLLVLGDVNGEKDLYVARVIIP